MKNHYISEYLRLNCSGQLQELFSQSANPYKEITESMAAWKNIKEYIDPKDKNHTYIFIGDGSLCLTGALFTFLAKGKTISIDPAVNVEKVSRWVERERVARLCVFKSTYQEAAQRPISEVISIVPIEMEDVELFDGNYDLILVHAHVNLTDLVKSFPRWRYLYTNPCCNPQEQTFSIRFQKENAISVLKVGYDRFNSSPQNMVFVYRNNKTMAV